VECYDSHAQFSYTQLQIRCENQSGYPDLLKGPKVVVTGGTSDHREPEIRARLCVPEAIPIIAQMI
jgi:hypothetical protein